MVNSSLLAFEVCGRFGAKSGEKRGKMGQKAGFSWRFGGVLLTILTTGMHSENVFYV
jgi:hypothetical protein